MLYHIGAVARSGGPLEGLPRQHDAAGARGETKHGREKHDSPIILAKG